MPEWLEALWSFLASLPRGIYGDRIDSGWGIAASIFVSVVAIAFVIGGYRSIHEYIKAADGTPPRKVDWLQARRQEVQSLRFTIPFGILVFTVLYLWVRDSFALDSYFRLAVGWVLFLLVLRVWWIATAIWTERKLVKNDLLATGKSQLHNVTIGWAVRHYLNWGLQKSTVKRPPFIGIFRIFRSHHIVRLTQ